ncbi:hypothetical protein [Stakelama tenebrarum]|uniref:Uncharacterized protein n=1 Tax=Stakelama tenebrarum TaxID=2711215 RepID=A0A6G6Y4Y8_9SPHN|nr:hypothetical protein [Sphingosinithalassobacter tenebrarum]QIG79959.1 hypothetical protein G5C33_09350 [Sphingosinithalassobacter tenebrarum]
MIAPNDPNDDRERDEEVERFVARAGSSFAILLFAVAILVILRWAGLGIDQ